jgi:hypothetical protein
MLNTTERRVHVSETERTGKIDRIHDHERLRAGPFTQMSRAGDFAYRPEPGEMRDTLPQEQSSLVEIRLSAY